MFHLPHDKLTYPIEKTFTVEEPKLILEVQN
jgi:hypothetical protein